MQNKTYEAPAMEILLVEDTDVIRTSGDAIGGGDDVYVGDDFRKSVISDNEITKFE